MAESFDFQTFTFNDEEFMLVQKITDFQLGEILQCMGKNGLVYINNNEIITNQEDIDRLDEQYWRSPSLRGRVETPRRDSIRDLNKGGTNYER